MQNFPINYLGNTDVKAMLDASPDFRKNDETLLRWPKIKEVNTVLHTKVFSGCGIRIESSATIDADSVIARNPKPLEVGFGEEEVFNEWVISAKTVLKSYGQTALDHLSTEFKPFKKQATIKMIKLTKEVMQILGQNGDVLPIAVSWSPDPMIAHVGDYLTSAGYSISADQFNTYAAI
jgi:hypothetical protein